jgi:hypothetical protein
MKLLIPSVLAALTIGLLPGEAEAHNRHRHDRHIYHGPPHVGLVCHRGDCSLRFGTYFHSPRRHRHNHNIRVSRDCVYKPHKDKLVCRY